VKRLLPLLFALGLGACGLGVVGTAPESDGGTPQTPTPLADGAVATDAEAGGGPANCSTSQCAALALTASGFTPIAFGAATDACPNGFDSADGFGEATPKSGSCACGACATTGSNCSTGNYPTSQSNDMSCANYGTPFPANGGTCKAYSNYWGSNYGGVGAPTPVLGTCHADAQVVRDKIDVTQSRVCTPRAGTCPAAMCSLTGTLNACLLALGDVACPSVAPKKTVIGDLQATCAACSCTPVATCSGKVHWWEVSTSCSGPESGTVPSNVCTLVNNKNIRSILWEGTATESCSGVTPAAQATVTRGNLKTVCCPG
jgi:hypothetical protein